MLHHAEVVAVIPRADDGGFGLAIAFAVAAFATSWLGAGTEAREGAA